jgi:hypothetical protein
MATDKEKQTISFTAIIVILAIVGFFVFHKKCSNDKLGKISSKEEYLKLQNDSLKLEVAASKGREQVYQKEKDSLIIILNYQLNHPQVIIEKYEKIRNAVANYNADSSISFFTRHLSKKRN